MQTVKPNETEIVELTKAAQMLKDANAQLASAKKNADSAKATLAKWLLEHRSINIETMKIGDIVNIEKVALVEIGKQSRFDLADFTIKQTALAVQFTKDFPTTKYKALV